MKISAAAGKPADPSILANVPKLITAYYELHPDPSNPRQRVVLSDVRATEVAGQPIQKILTTAPGDGHPIGGIKVIAEDGWFAARPSGTEEIYKIYAESFIGRDHLRQIEEEAQTIVSEALGRSTRAA